jgi:hypothetical protein
VLAATPIHTSAGEGGLSKEEGARVQRETCVQPTSWSRQLLAPFSFSFFFQNYNVFRKTATRCFRWRGIESQKNCFSSTDKIQPP